MGIDIYAAWERQAEEEKKAQATGFSVVACNVGYLREAYHGGPYVTKYLVPEAFEAGYDGVKISAATLRERLPVAVLIALYRNNKVYGGKKEPTIIEIEELEKVNAEGVPNFLADVFASMKDESHKDIASQLNEKSIEHAKTLIEGGVLPDYAQSFVDFVKLCEQKEVENGAPCLIRCSA